jgi:DNA (cytosine-5)-methyltransferase 1
MCRHLIIKRLNMEYISCFSGIGGLEGTKAPKAICEIDPVCRQVLSLRFPKAKQFDDIRTITPDPADLLVGGWPCQDLSVAGQRKGLAGENSGLFYNFVNVAILAKVRAIVAENVPNLIKMDRGTVFTEVLREFENKGFRFSAWRTLNAREFGLPHHRRRIFIVASKSRSDCLTLFRPIPARNDTATVKKIASGFYWTAGSQSICYSQGYVPTIKVGSTLSIASPPAVHYNDVVRQITPDEALKLQGFDPTKFQGIHPSAIYKMAGNAVARPVGQFVVDGVLNELKAQEPKFILRDSDLFDDDAASSAIPDHGMYENGRIHTVAIDKSPSLCCNLGDILDDQVSVLLSARAAAGLLSRLNRSGLSCPEDLREILLRLSKRGLSGN